MRCNYDESCHQEAVRTVETVYHLCSEHLVAFAEELLEQDYAKARVDFNAFAEAVATDDETGEPLRQAGIHKKWAELCDKYDNLLIWSHVESGKTTQLSILRTVWELGRNPNLRFVILSNTTGIAKKIVAAIADLIEANEAVHRIFPRLKPHPKGPWTTTELKVMRTSSAKDPSVRAVGVGTDLTSGRCDRLVVDDILDPENTLTEDQRKKVENWYQLVVPGRKTKKCKTLIVGTAYHPEDLLHKLSVQAGCKWVRFPIINSKGVVTWPEAWPPERIQKKRVEMGPINFARNMLCKARDDGEARFKKEWTDAALKKGKGIAYRHSIELEDIPEGHRVFTGVDLAIKRSKKADKTAFFTFIEDEKGNRTILDITAGKFTGPDIVDRIIDIHNRYHGIVSVENNAAQDFILQFARDISNVPVVPHTTTAAKRDPLLGVEGLAIELANGKWIFPCEDPNFPPPEIEAFIQEMLFYTPQAHTGDRLMAAYFARERARRMLGNRGAPGVSVRVVGASDYAPAQTVSPSGPRLAAMFDVPDVSTEESRARNGRV